MTSLRLFVLFSLVFSIGCLDDTIDPSGDDDFPLSDSEALFMGAPDNDSLPENGKADDSYPAKFDLISTQSPVQSQGSRGTCSIFASTALMEHLYISEGTISDPDFSEQFLQWSTKFELNIFPNTSGSNARQNVDAINRFGSVEEDVWPYETSEWGTSNDPACTGDDRPTRCYTNGTPPAEALSAQRYHLPRSQYIRTSERSIKAHMTSTNSAVTISVDFFYQSWGHGKSGLTVYTPYKELGYIQSPSDEDKTDSATKKAGHAVLIVGWDDDLEIQRVNPEGELEVDADGEPVMERGFFLIKNSWGTGWAQGSEFGPGYGWIGYDYVLEYGSASGSGIPEVNLTEQSCNDSVDNDGDGALDCADSDCAMRMECMAPPSATTVHPGTPNTDIPDNNPMGVSDTINVVGAGNVVSVAVAVSIQHEYRGDLTLILEKDGTESVLVEREGGSVDDINATFTPTDFNGIDAAGDWTLRVIDGQDEQVGSFNSWVLTVTRCEGTDCTGGAMNFMKKQETLTVIPDDGSTVTSTISIDQAGTVAGLVVNIDVEHAFFGDLTITLKKGDRSIVLVTEDLVGGSSHQRQFNVSDFDGDELAGDWELDMVDVAQGDQGFLSSWSIRASYN